MLLSGFKKTRYKTYNELFWKNGYLYIKDYFTNKQADNIVKIADELDKFNEEKGKWMIYFEKDKVKKKARIENIINYHSELKELVDYNIKPNLELIYQKRMNLFKDKMNWKKGFGKGFKAHQDQPAWSDFPPQRFVSVAMFGNKTTIDNGCLEFSAGNHKEGLYDYDMSSLGELKPEVEESLEWTPIETSPRDLLLFDSYVPHRSNCNKTSFDRRIFYFTYNAEEDGNFYQDYIKKKRIEFPPDIERESGKEYKVKGSRYNLANPIE